MNPGTPAIARIDQKTGAAVLLFPDDPWNESGDVTSWSPADGHGPAGYAGMIETTRPASADEAEALVRSYETAPPETKLRLIERKGTRT